MTFDIFVQPLARAAAPTSQDPAVRSMLLDFAETYEPESRFAHLGFPDGHADVFGVPPPDTAFEGLMFNHVAGLEACELIVRVARATDSVIMPAGCPLCLVDPVQRGSLPDAPALLEAGIVIVTSGAHLRAVIEG